MLRFAIGFVVSTPPLEELAPDVLEPDVLEPDVLEPDVLEPGEPDELEVWTELEVVVVVGPWLVELPPVASETTCDAHDAEATSGKVTLRRMARPRSWEAADGTIDMGCSCSTLRAFAAKGGTLSSPSQGITPNFLPTFSNASSARSRCPRSCVAM
jgi:hypothetical protein